ncbi:MAG: tyrosine--tRNA ligase, partial [Acetobacteraceae bacterium]|nr:tyrosine--tRNA ligase [Acetobacteraceae bacterium]
STEREIILFENAGVGRSGGAVPASITAMAEHVLQFVGAIALSKFHLLGYSLGGFLAQEIAIAKPDLVERMVLSGSAPEGGKGASLVGELKGLGAREQLEILCRGTAEVITAEELEGKLGRSLREGRPLRVKWGIDPTAPDIHLGHAVVLRKMKQFQDLGHEVVLLIGDFTGRVGDPSGRDETRRQLDAGEVERNAQTYMDQAFRILDRRRTVVDHNARWLAGLSFQDLVFLASRFTVARMLEREDFAQRFRAEVPIHVHEFFYPLMQGYDSVALKSDVELGGTDQRFNILAARKIQADYGQEPEVAVLTPILEGTDGVERMSKSKGNYIGISEPPDQMYGKTMSIPDAVMPRYFELACDLPPAELRAVLEGLRKGTLHPRDAKMRLAREIVTLYHGAEAAREAERNFVRVFREGLLPEEVPLATVPAEMLGADVRLSRLLVASSLVASGSEAIRVISQSAVRVDGVRVDDPFAVVRVREGSVIQVGKRRVARLAAAPRPGREP